MVLQDTCAHSGAELGLNDHSNEVNRPDQRGDDDRDERRNQDIGKVGRNGKLEAAQTEWPWWVGGRVGGSVGGSVGGG